MLRDFAVALVTVVVCTGSAQAHDYLWFAGGSGAYAHSGYSVNYHSVTVAPAVVAAPVVVAAPGGVAAPVVGHQPADVVPTGVSYVSYPTVGHRRAPVSVATYSHLFAQTVPTLTTYYAPRYTQSHFVRHRPRGLNIRIRYR